MTEKEEVSTEIELNFRLDENGRTAPTTTTAEQQGGAFVTSPPAVDYRSQTVQTTLVYAAVAANDDDDNNKDIIEGNEALLDEILLDCEIADSGLMPRTFWMPAHGKLPRCSLEQMAWQVFHHHVPADAVYDHATSGAEWWVQIRPSPSAAGRYTMHAAEDLNDEISRNGIWFHWDKDEDLRQIMGGDTTYIHPHLSTVTYLTPHGAPTLAINRRIHPLTGEWIVPSSASSSSSSDDNTEEQGDQAWISWPKRGKHLSFDGRYLHAAPPDLLPLDARHRPVAPNQSVDDPAQRKVLRRQRRVTFLVNLWLNYHPLNVQPFPESMLDKMSGRQTEKRANMTFAPRSVVSDQCKGDKGDNLKKFEWPMGGCDSGEYISLTLPLEQVQRQHQKGGNCFVKWSQGFVQLSKYNPNKKLRLDDEEAKTRNNSQDIK